MLLPLYLVDGKPQNVHIWCWQCYCHGGIWNNHPGWVLLGRCNSHGDSICHHAYYICQIKPTLGGYSIYCHGNNICQHHIWTFCGFPSTTYNGNNICHLTKYANSNKKVVTTSTTKYKAIRSGTVKIGNNICQCNANFHNITSGNIIHHTIMVITSATILAIRSAMVTWQ